MEESRPWGYYLGCIHCKSCNLLKLSLQPIPILTSFTNTVINLICINTVPELVEWRVILVRTNQRLAAQRFSVNYPVMSGSNYSTYSSLGSYGNSALFLNRSQYISWDFYVQCTLVIVNSVLSQILFTNERCLLFRLLLLPESTVLRKSQKAKCGS